MATMAARHLDLIAVAWGKATTFVVGGRENKCAIGRSTAQRSAQALGNNLCESISRKNHSAVCRKKTRAWSISSRRGDK